MTDYHFNILNSVKSLIESGDSNILHISNILLKEIDFVEKSLLIREISNRNFGNASFIIENQISKSQNRVLYDQYDIKQFSSIDLKDITIEEIKKHLSISNLRLFVIEDDEGNNTDVFKYWDPVNKISIVMNSRLIEKIRKDLSTSLMISRNINISNETKFVEFTVNEFKSISISDFESQYDKDLYDRTFNDYNGSYAQDEAGFSDHEINDAFDGDPENYWNID